MSILGQQVETLKRAWRRMPEPVRKKVRKKLPKTVLARIAPSRPASPRKAAEVTLTPLLTVIVPVYNVEKYLEQCLESICRQTYENLEILVVDDGSTDASLTIAEQFAEVDQRIRIIRQPNAGLGAARNSGIREASGEFIAFVDSDDLVQKDAYKVMLKSLKASGSDFVVGSLNRLIGSKREVPAWAKKVHASNRIAIQIADFPEVLQDVFAWNKVFRKTFWDDNIGAFPEGVLYEDQEPTARAYMVSSRFDVLQDVVYDWRIREDRSSITQNKNSIRDLSDRLHVCAQTRRIMDEKATPDVLNSWLSKVLGPDLMQYYVQVPRTDVDYWETLRTGVKEIVSHLSPALLRGLEMNQRVMVYLVLSGTRDDLIKVAVHQSEYGAKYPLVRKSSQLFAQPAYLKSLDTDVPDEVLAVLNSELKIKSRITSITQSAQRVVSLQGFAYIEGLNADHETQVSVAIVDTVSGRSLTLPTRMTGGFDVDQIANDPWNTYSNGYFETQLDFDHAIDKGLSTSHGSEWALSLTVSQAGEVVVGNIQSRDMSGTAATLPLISTKNNVRHILRFSQALGLSVISMAYKRFVVEATVKGREVEIGIDLPRDEVPQLLRLECPDDNISRDILPVSAENPNKFSFILPAVTQDSPTTNTRWKIRVGTNDGKFHHLAWPKTTAALRELSDGPAQTVTVGATGYGYVELFERPWNILARSVEVSSDARLITVRGTAVYDDASSARILLPKLVLASNHRTIEAKSISWLGENQFAVKFSTEEGAQDVHALAPESGFYTLRAHTVSESGPNSMYWVPVSFDLEQRLPIEECNDHVRIRVTRTPKAAALGVTFSPPFRQDERGKHRQTKLQAQIHTLIKTPVATNVTLFESFGGSGISDSGLGIFNEMVQRGDESVKYWSVKDASISVPEGAERLIRYSRRWYEVLHTAGYVVNNNNFPFFYRKNPGQKYIQTWHGTPLKKIGNDIPSSSLSLAYINLMQRESEYWDVLLAQNDFASATLPGAFSYSGEVVNLGYPRNDSLVGRLGHDKREEVRSRLGLRADQKVVLYAPTWRDNIRSFNNQYMLADFLDYSVAGEVLGPDYVFLLRGHSNVSAGRDTPTHPGVVDVTSYPNINDLLLAADILVTDYSSVMFDFCVTGKPIYFLTPDLDDYRDNVRGFYFDFEEEAPGPLCNTTLDLAESIRDDVSGTQFAEKYAAFKTRFAPRDDGNASQRVYEAIWNH